MHVRALRHRRHRLLVFVEHRVLSMFFCKPSIVPQCELHAGLGARGEVVVQLLADRPNPELELPLPTIRGRRGAYQHVGLQGKDIEASRVLGFDNNHL